MTEKSLHQLQPLKELHKDLRSEAAQQTLQARDQLRQVEMRLHESKTIASELSSELSNLYEQNDQLQVEYDSFASRSLLKKLASLLRGPGSSSVDIQGKMSSLGDNIDLKTAEREMVAGRLAVEEDEMQNVPKPHEVLEDYKERLATEPLSNGEKRKLLTPDFLAALSTDQYIELWRKLTPFFVSHITRHGVRQHTGSFHSGGVGYYSDGGKAMLADGKLRSRHAINGLQANDPAAMNKYLEQEDVFDLKDAETALDDFEKTLNYQVANAERYPDNSSIHFATGKILDRMYGGEQDNQVFAIFPADAIASQFNFSFSDGRITTFDVHDSDERNDLFVYPNNTQDPGIDLNSGIVFLPKNVMVDKKTGSQYQVAERDYDYGWKVIPGVMPVIDTELVSQFKEFLHQLSVKEEEVATRDSGHEYEAEFLNGLQALGMERQFADDLSKRAYIFLKSNKIDTNDFDTKMKDLLYSYPYFWQKAKDAVKAEEYWENVFATSPERRPKHIIYYDGDPNSAVEQFLVKNGIKSSQSPDMDKPYLGYQDHCIVDTKHDRRAYPGYQEIIGLAKEIINNHYATKPTKN